MNRRLWFSIALIAVLFGSWLVLTRPICQDGFAASLVTRAGWSCVANWQSEMPCAARALERARISQRAAPMRDPLATFA
jgi:hypothetical protein